MHAWAYPARLADGPSPDGSIDARAVGFARGQRRTGLRPCAQPSGFFLRLDLDPRRPRRAEAGAACAGSTVGNVPPSSPLSIKFGPEGALPPSSTNSALRWRASVRPLASLTTRSRQPAAALL